MGLFGSKIWREYDLELENKEWNYETVQNLSNGVVKFAGIKSESGSNPKLKIMLIGHTGSGKSCLINSFRGALTGLISNIAVEGGRDHTTEKFSEFPAYTEDGKELDFAFYDLRGTGSASAASVDVDVLRAVLGKKKIGERFVPGERHEDALDEAFVDEETPHVILYVMDGAAFDEKIKQGEDDQWLSVLYDLKAKTDRWNLPRYLVVTNMDKADPYLLKNIKQMNKSYKVNQIVEMINDKTKFPTKVILPVINPVGATHTMADSFRVYFLYLLWAIVKDAKEVLQHRLYEQKRQHQQSKEGRQ